jgi:hypothetical protein
MSVFLSCLTVYIEGLEIIISLLSILIQSLSSHVSLPYFTTDFTNNFYQFGCILVDIPSTVIFKLRFEVLAAKMPVVTVFWIATPYSLVGGYQLTLILKMEKIRSSETLVNTCKTAQCHNQQDHNRQFGNLLPQKLE